MEKYQKWKKNFPEKDKNFGLLVFSTDKMLETLSNSKITLCDGTFKCVPKPFQQLFTIFGVKAGRKLPLIIALMKRKTTGDYRRLFKILKEKIFKLTGQLNWNPDFYCLISKGASDRLLKVSFGKRSIGAAIFTSRNQFTEKCNFWVLKYLTTPTPIGKNSSGDCSL